MGVWPPGLLLHSSEVAILCKAAVKSKHLNYCKLLGSAGRMLNQLHFCMRTENLISGYLLVKLFQGGCHIHPKVSPEGEPRTRFKALILLRSSPVLRPRSSATRHCINLCPQSPFPGQRVRGTQRRGWNLLSPHCALGSFFSYKDALGVLKQ